MAENNTNIEITVYSGVPFNKKYQNVLFVSKETRNTFLANYDVSDEITLQRFSIVDDGTPFIDISNDYDGMTVNYVRIKTTLLKENSQVPYVYEKFYFVDDVRQLTTNTTRLFLDVDIFQTYFNKYNYNKEEYEIPEIVNSKLEITTDPVPNEKTNVLEMSNFNDDFTYSSLFTNTYPNEIFVVFQFTETNGYQFQTAVAKLPTYIFSSNSDLSHYRLQNIIHALQNGKLFYDYNGTPMYNTQITVNHIYIIPRNVFSIDDVPHSANGRYYLKDNQDANFEVDVYPLSMDGEYQYNKSVSKTLTLNSYTQTSIGNFEKQIELPYNSISYSVKLNIMIGDTFQVILSANNQSIDLTYSFEISLLKNEYNEFMNSHENSIAVKSVSNAINLLSGIGTMASGNPASIISTSKTIRNIADDISSYSDLKKQPAKIVAEKSLTTSFLLFNMIGIIENRSSNYQKIQEYEKYFGQRTNYLVHSRIFEYLETPQSNIQYNFSYFKFANVELIGKINENYKQRIEEMFTNGIRIWYNASNFLQTTENKEIIT